MVAFSVVSLAVLVQAQPFPLLEVLAAGSLALNVWLVGVLCKLEEKRDEARAQKIQEMVKEKDETCSESKD